MINFPASLKAPGGAHSGMAPAHLLDVLDVNGNAYYWSDRPINAPRALQPFVQPSVPGFPLTPPIAAGAGQSIAWMYPQAATTQGLANFTRSGPGLVGVVQQFFQGPFTAPNILTFQSFQPALPPGAIVDAAYLVCNHSAWPSEGYMPFADTVGDVGQSSVILAGAPGSGYSVAFEFHNTLGPAPGSPGYIGPFIGYDSQFLQIFAIGVCVYYHTPAGSGGGGGGGGGSLSLPNYGPYVAWILSVPKIVFNRSLATDTGSFVLQNLSGDTMQRDFEKIARRSALEGAMFIYRLWDPAARASWIEHHGTFTVEGIPRETVSLKGSALTNLATYDTPMRQIGETCQQVIWGGRGCGATGSTECQYSFQTCQVPERFMGSLNNYEKNYGESLANVALKVINRRRRI